jgi:lipopolysaccharide export system permease protein
MPLPLLDRYIVVRMMLFTFAILVLIITILQMLDLLSQADEIMAAPGASLSSLAKYASLRAPDFVVRFTPFAVLLAVLLNLTQLASASEIIAMRAAGMSPTHILRPMLIGAAGIALTHFAFQELVAAKTSSKLQVWQDLGYARLHSGADQENSDIWLSTKGLILNAGTASRFGPDTHISDLVVYQIDSEGLLAGVIKSKSAQPGEPSWLLKDTLRCTSEDTEWTKEDQIGWTAPLEVSEFFPNAQPNSVHQLHRETKRRRLRNEPSANLSTTLFSHFSRPLSDLIMPLIGLFIGFSLPRSGQFAKQLLVGLSIGFLFFALDSFFIAVGNSGAVPAFVAAFGAPFLFAATGAYSLIALEK